MNSKINDLLDRVEQFHSENSAEIEDFRIKMIGKKGELTALMDEFKRRKSDIVCTIYGGMEK